MLSLLSCPAPFAAATPETYRDYVWRGNPPLPATLAGIVEGVSDQLEPLISANEAFLEQVAWQEGVASPSADARIAVPLLVQAVRDWSAEGAPERAACYAPVVAALREHVTATQPRILVPGSALGRLAFDVAASFAGSEVVCVEPDVHSQLAASNLMLSLIHI